MLLVQSLYLLTTKALRTVSILKRILIKFISYAESGLSMYDTAEKMLNTSFAYKNKKTEGEVKANFTELQLSCSMHLLFCVFVCLHLCVGLAYKSTYEDM